MVAKALMGYMGKVLWVGLSAKTFRDKAIIEEGEYRKFLGGYGLGFKVMYENMKPKADPLGADNIIGFCSSLLDGTAAGGGRFGIVAKSPASGTCWDSNVGGTAGPRIKGKYNYGRAIYYSVKRSRNAREASYFR
jgi:aldehyde:ferredoxin oxidoreductase